MEEIKKIFEQYKPYSYIVAVVAGFMLLKTIIPRSRKRVRRSPVVVVKKSGGVRRRKTKVVVPGAKKAWQIKGSPEAKRRMARLRAMRSR